MKTITVNVPDDIMEDLRNVASANGWDVEMSAFVALERYSERLHRTERLIKKLDALRQSQRASFTPEGIKESIEEGRA